MRPMHERFNVVLHFVEIAELVTPRLLGERALAAPLPPASTGAPELFPPVELTWLLFSLMHYQQRKNWAFDLFETRIRPGLPREPQKLMVTIEDVLDGGQEGLVRGMPEWTYEIDGSRSFVTNRATGERIHIDVINGPRLICDWAFIEFLEKHREPRPACKRLLELHPHRRGVECTLEIFRDCWPEHQVDESDFELCGMFAPHYETVDRFCERWADGTDRLWEAGVIGDWCAAVEAAQSATDAPMRQHAENRAQQSRRAWLSMLLSRIDEYGLDDSSLSGLANAGADDLRQYLERAFSRREGLATAVELIADDSSWCETVLSVLADPEARRCGVSTELALYLSRHDYRTRDVISLLTQTETPQLWPALVVALERAPDLLPVLLKRALRSPFPPERLMAAAMAALIDSEWSRAELIDLLRSSADQDATIEWRAALRQSRDAAARLEADDWEFRHADTGKPPITSWRFLYNLGGGCEALLLGEMDELRSRVTGSWKPQRASRFRRIPPL